MSSLTLSNIVFSESVSRVDSDAPPFLVVDDMSGGLGSGSEIAIDSSEFRDFTTGAIAVATFQSNSPDSSGSRFVVRSSVFANNIGGTLDGIGLSGGLSILDASNSTVEIADSTFESNSGFSGAGASADSGYTCPT